MKIRYFSDTDTALIEFSEVPVAETRNVTENLHLELAENGNLVSMTIEHAKKQANISESTLPQDNPYKDVGTGKPKIKLSCCVYMDILGFKDKVLTAFEEGKETELFNKLHSIMLDGWNILDHYRKIFWEEHGEAPFLPARWKSKFFTDSVVLGHVVESSDGEMEFGDVIRQLASYQTIMALEGIFVRGGFTLGQLYVGEEIVYGKALLDAYDIENEIANNPRIVISKDVMSLINKHLDYYADPKDSLANKYVLIDADKQPFVNYLEALHFTDDVFGYDELKKHKQNIEHYLIESQDKPCVQSKYLWLANYHNYFCKIKEEFPINEDEYLIDLNVAIQKPKRLVN